MPGVVLSQFTSGLSGLGIVVRLRALQRLEEKGQAVRPARLERATYSFGGCHSIQLSYGRSGAVIITADSESTTEPPRQSVSVPLAAHERGRHGGRPSRPFTICPGRARYSAPFSTGDPAL